jgi:hypothetical protein
MRVNPLEGLVALMVVCSVARSALAQDGRITVSQGPETPNRLSASFVRGATGELYLVDRSDGEVLAIDGTSFVGAVDEAPSFADIEANQDGAPELAARFVRESDTTGQLILAGDDAMEVRLQSRSGGRLIDGRALRRIGDQLFVIQEELDLTSERIGVRRFVVEYNRATPGLAGRFVAELDVGDVEVVDDSYIAIVDATRALYLAEWNGSVVAEDVSLSAELGATSPEQTRSNSAPRQRNRRLRRGFQNEVRRSAGEDDAPELRQPLTRERALRSARAFLEATWMLQEQNFGRELRSECSVPDNVWRRPTKLEQSTGLQITGLPYKWGGFMSIRQFAQRLSEGAIAGDICTCRQKRYNYCIVPQAAGVDCSGFVSQVWEIPYHSTSYLHEVSTPIAFDELKPGDALNKAGSHVRLFLGFEDDAKTSVRIIESAVECDGVCESVISVARLGGYVPIRLSTILD